MPDTPEDANTSHPPEVAKPGDRIKELLEEKGWTQADLRKHADWPGEEVDNLLNGRKAIDAFSALHLEEVFGVPAETWMELETAHQLSIGRRFQPGGRPAWTLVLGAFIEDRDGISKRDPGFRLSSFLHKVFPYALHYRMTVAELIVATDDALNSNDLEVAEWKSEVGMRTVREFNAVAALLRALSK